MFFSALKTFNHKQKGDYYILHEKCLSRDGKQDYNKHSLTNPLMTNAKQQQLRTYRERGRLRRAAQKGFLSPQTCWLVGVGSSAAIKLRVRRGKLLLPSESHSMWRNGEE